MVMEQQPELVVDDAPVWDRPLIAVPTFALLAMIGGMFKSFSVTANIYVLMLGGALMWLGLSDRAAKRSGLARLGPAARWWLLPAAMFLVVEATNFALGSTYAHPTLSVLMDGLLAGYPIRTLAYFAWLGSFWGLVRR